MEDLPERLRGSDEPSGAADPPQAGPPMAMNMNQSIFGLIAAAGSRVDFNQRFDGGSSSSSEGDDDDDEGDDEAEEEDLTQTTILQPPIRSRTGKPSVDKSKRPGRKILKSLPSLPRRKPKPKRLSSKTSQQRRDDEAADNEAADNEEVAEDEAGTPSEPSTPPAVRLLSEDSRRPSVMSQMLEARAEMANRASFELERLSGDAGRKSTDSDDATPLARRLMHIFEFEEPEQVIEGGYSSLLLGCVLEANVEQNIPAGCSRAFSCKAFSILLQSTFVFMLTYPRRRSVFPKFLPSELVLT